MELLYYEKTVCHKLICEGYHYCDPQHTKCLFFCIYMKVNLSVLQIYIITVLSN